MFEELELLLSDLRQRVDLLQSVVVYAGDYFRAVALADCYNKLIEFASERTEQHPEVQRVPELRTILLAHLVANADKHIDVRTDRIFNPLLLGSPKALRDWQEAGWRTRRTASNYSKRLEYWRAIYDGAPIIHQKRVSSGDDLFNTSGAVYQAMFSTRRVSRRVKNLQGQTNHIDVTYEDIIHARNANYSATYDLVPWWEVLNYGTTFAGVAGYPDVPGLHFVEDAERLVPSTVQRYFGLFNTYINSVFDSDLQSRNALTNIEQWIKENVKLSAGSYIDPSELARIVTFGVPF